MTTYGVAPLELGLTSRLCANLAATRFDDLPETVRHEAKRALIDWIGCAMAGSAHPTIDKTVAALSAVAGNGPGSLVARTERLGLLEAAIAKIRQNADSATPKSDIGRASGTMGQKE